MRFLLSIIAVLALSQISDVFASDCVVDTSTPTFINGKRVDSRCDENGRVKVIATLEQTAAGEDVVNDVLKFESQFDYEPVAASQTDQVMGTTGAAGDNLHSVLCVFTGIPSAAVQIKDGTGAAINVIAITGGADTKQVFFDAPSADGGWKITTGTNTTCFVTGRFS